MTQEASCDKKLPKYELYCTIDDAFGDHFIARVGATSDPADIHSMVLSIQAAMPDNARKFYYTSKAHKDPHATRVYLAPADDPRQCRICGCMATVIRTTPDSAHLWTEEDLCSHCAALLTQKESIL
jgi:hypothetical protein